MCREEESDKTCNSRCGASHHIAARRIEQLTKRHVLIGLGSPRGDKMNRRIDANTKRTAYVKFICQILPDRKPANVSRSFYRTYDNNANIISDIEDTFRPVADLLEAA